jgi:2-dehydropantoate 2-reductase
MRIVIAGAGAVGGYIGARLARAGADVVLFARGPHLQAMQARGLRVTSAEGDFEVRPQVTGDLTTIGKADVVFLGVKAHGLTALAPALRPLFGPDTAVVSTQNGIPWWYFQNYGGELDGLRLERVDPGGVIAASIEPGRVIGSLAYFATDVAEPGVIHHTEGNRISFGEPDGSKSDRAKAIAETLIAAGFRCPVTARFRHEIWVKLLGNVAFNPISALTGGTLEELARHPDTSKVVREIMTETEAVAGKLGIEMPISIEQRMAGAEKVGAHKTSMLQDLEAGRPLELEAVVGAVIELGDRLGVPMPATRAVYACAKMADEKRHPPSRHEIYDGATARQGGEGSCERAQRSEPRERSEPAKRLARERVGESEGRSPSE